MSRMEEVGSSFRVALATVSFGGVGSRVADHIESALASMHPEAKVDRVDVMEFVQPTAWKVVEESYKAVLALLRRHLDEDVVQEEAVLDFLHRYGPFDPVAVEAQLQRMLERAPADQHVSWYLEAIRAQLEGGAR